MTVTEVAELLKQSRTIVYQLIMSGEIPSYKLGKSRRIRKSDVESWIANRVVAQKQEG
jgi:excisionase family DNA binding protein